MFEKILIANRGEIACRVIRTAKALGVTPLRLFRCGWQAQHVRMADEAVYLGDNAPAGLTWPETRSLRRHCLPNRPYIRNGFLSENADFAESCEQRGLAFIGPPVRHSIMGSKSAAKQAMHSAGVPLLPGYHEVDQDPSGCALPLTLVIRYCSKPLLAVVIKACVRYRA